MADTADTSQPDTGNATSPRRRGKSASAFKTISEVSDELDLPQHVLRFWETKFTAIKPLKSGGRRRYYRPEDIEVLRRIQSLLYDDGYTIKGVQKLLRKGGLPETVAQEPAEATAPESEASMPTGEPGPNKAELEAILRELEDLRGMLNTSTS